MNAELKELNPYITGVYAPTPSETTTPVTACSGEIPLDLSGMYVRNGPNPMFAVSGKHHWFDGDGMLHAIRFNNGRAIYSNRWIRTEDLTQEQVAGQAIWSGIREPISWERIQHPYKDSANTDVKFHNGELVAVWYQCGKPYRVNPFTLETTRVDDFDGKLKTKVSAHVKVDAITGEMMFFEYGIVPPFMSYGVVSPHGDLLKQVDIPLPGARLPHDMAITEHYSILMDLPVFWDAEALKKGKWKSRFHPDTPSRFGIIPRHGDSNQVQWFETSPCYIYHVINAWEEGDEVVMMAHRVANPIADSEQHKTEFERMLRNLQMHAETYCWRFNLKTGAATETLVDSTNAEFPTINMSLQGRKTRYAYAMLIPDKTTLIFDGLMKYDFVSGQHQRYEFGENCFASEAGFAPKIGAQAEDDGYVVTFVTLSDAEQTEASQKSECWIFDAKNISTGPICKIAIPVRMPAGFHACWVEGADLDKAK